MRPQSIRWFERALLPALALDLVNNFAAWPILSAQIAASGLPAQTPLLVVSCLLAPLIGLLLWYLIARRGSVVAKWVMTVLVALAVLVYIRTLLQPIAPGGRAMLMLAVVAEALKVYAVTCLFRADARAWLGARRAA